MWVPEDIKGTLESTGELNKRIIELEQKVAELEVKLASKDTLVLRKQEIDKTTIPIDSSLKVNSKKELMEQASQELTITSSGEQPSYGSEDEWFGQGRRTSYRPYQESEARTRTLCDIVEDPGGWPDDIADFLGF